MIVFRMLLTIASLLLALPAAAAPACHEAPTAKAVHHGHAPPAAPIAAPTAHDCIGCIPPSDWDASRIVARLPMPAMAMTTRIATLDPGEAAPPVLPPPRHG